MALLCAVKNIFEDWILQFVCLFVSSVQSKELSIIRAFFNSVALQVRLG